MGLKGILFQGDGALSYAWSDIVDDLLHNPRSYQLNRVTKETNIQLQIILDSEKNSRIETGLDFFDHMLHQLAKHGGFNLDMTVQGDLNVDEHHTIEDTAIALGSAMKGALQQKMGIGRYGFVLPMDEALAQVAIDLCGRAYFTFEGEFNREKVGDLPTEMVPHFFRTLADSLGAALHIKIKGENTHHMIEAIFKGVGRTLKQAFSKTGTTLPTTKGIL
jgi:imidazoleglycerol-phosphate dehydratase/histidinol-phosphatase